MPLAPEDLVRQGAMGPRMLRFLSACVRGRANVVVSGGTNSGKTTLLGVVSTFIPEDERLISHAAYLRSGHATALPLPSS